MFWKKHKKKVILGALVLVVLAAAVPVIIVQVGKLFTAQETVVRTDWTMDVGKVVDQDEELQVEYAQAELGDGIDALQLVPMDIEEEGFTYYDVEVQERLDAALENLKNGSMNWTATTPLMVLNPYGTGSNGLYVYFETDANTQVTYTVHVEDETIPDFTETAADSSGEEYTKVHEFQIIGLVPGMTNQVTMEISGSWGNVRQSVSFTVDMPETQSGYETQLEIEEGDSQEELSEGLYALMRVNGYLGYGYFFDNSGVLRYEMMLEGFGMDRILDYENDIITCVSAGKLARIDGLGQVKQVYDLGNYELHHDIGFGQNGELLALAEDPEGETVEDLVLSIDLETGEVTELLDFTQVLPDYFADTRPIAPTDPMFWQAGEWDWIHLNSLQYMAEDDSLIVSSRETSTIIKVRDIHGEVQVDWLAGDERFWEDTAYEEYCLEQEGDFVPQYGQHCVEYLEAGDEEGVYSLAVFNNNYWALSSRDDFTLDVEDSVGTDLYQSGDETSQVYVYRIDENQRTYALESSFDVPYSSIVSNGSRYGEEEHWIVNSGVAQVFGEYDAQGNLIREFSYDCTMQNYRTFKYDFSGFWFA
ncbi:MAG TPA: aryl-sulfate sulfotransferase [Candidatus Blautia gallistercoris]|uniref:Aryl-sulfate sulfotransferase n=1 Tax=Candidatus Blautia gallistercoris TaxID=2838490 RepID=A0A9D1WL86_9FIRM|nr:aryl-sulfate sulfotransferase [Candidatus Blautia gallistercoris]